MIYIFVGSPSATLAGCNKCNGDTRPESRFSLRVSFTCEPCDNLNSPNKRVSSKWKSHSTIYPKMASIMRADAIFRRRRCGQLCVILFSEVNNNKSCGTGFDWTTNKCLVPSHSYFRRFPLHFTCCNVGVWVEFTYGVRAQIIFRLYRSLSVYLFPIVPLNLIQPIPSRCSRGIIYLSMAGGMGAIANCNFSHSQRSAIEQ